MHIKVATKIYRFPLGNIYNVLEMMSAHPVSWVAEAKL